MSLLKRTKKKKQQAGKIDVFNVRWYPSSQSCVCSNDHRVMLSQYPPLMVRKAAWRA